MSNCNEILLLQYRARLTEILPKTASPKLNTAIEYAIGNKGKMVRASIVIATAKMFNIKNQAAIIDIATSIELIHLYSLIHDDLPAMDDDDLRRGCALSIKSLTKPQLFW